MGKSYEQTMPLISLHVPKCGGESLYNSIFECQQSGFRVIQYYPEVGMSLPEDWNAPRIIIHGHFVRWKGQPVEEICPAADQYTTVVREPFNTMISGYFYGLQNNYGWATGQSIDSFLDWWIESGTSPLFGALPALGSARTIEDYVNRFVLIGVLEHLNAYTERLGRILNVKMSAPGRIKTSRYVSEIPDRRAEFRKLMSLEYELFDYVKSLYA